MKLAERNGHAWLLTVLCTLCLATLWGCQQPQLSPAERAQLARRQASQLTAEAAPERAAHPDHAKSLLQKAISTDPTYIPARNNLATIYLSEGKLPEAAVELRLALSLDSQVPQTHYNMGLVYERSGRYSSAAEELVMARGLDPDNVEIQKALVRVWYRLRNTGKDMQDLVRSLLRKLDDPAWVSWLNSLLIAPAELKPTAIAPSEPNHP